MTNLKDVLTAEERKAQEKIGAQEAVDAHLQKEGMVVEADDAVTSCVDGRYMPTEAVGSIAFPGADLGLCMALLRMGYSPQEAFDQVYAFITEQENRPFFWHTDDHSEVGCGHCNAAITQGERYGLSGAAVRELLGVIEAATADEFRNIKRVTLEGKHAEQAILIVQSATHSVLPFDPDSGKQFFIYDQLRHHALLGRLAEFLAPKTAEETLQELINISQEQTNVTLGLLGSSQGKAIFAVSQDNGAWVANFLDWAPDFSQES